MFVILLFFVLTVGLVIYRRAEVHFHVVLRVSGSRTLTFMVHHMVSSTELAVTEGTVEWLLPFVYQHVSF